MSVNLVDFSGFWEQIFNETASHCYLRIGLADILSGDALT
jgi:hypothetical protein